MMERIKGPATSAELTSNTDRFFPTITTSFACEVDFTSNTSHLPGFFRINRTEREKQGTKREPRIEDTGFSVNNILYLLLVLEINKVKKGDVIWHHFALRVAME